MKPVMGISHLMCFRLSSTGPEGSGPGSDLQYYYDTFNVTIKYHFK